MSDSNLKAQLAALQSECAALRAALSIAQDAGQELCAEVERLRVESGARRNTLFQKCEDLAAEWRRAEGAESRLAAANALLQRVGTWRTPHGYCIPNNASETLDDIHTHLAAPSATAPEVCVTAWGEPTPEHMRKPTTAPARAEAPGEAPTWDDRDRRWFRMTLVLFDAIEKELDSK